MKRIICDLCNREIGVTVDTAYFTTQETCKYQGMFFEQRTEKDICSECSNHIKKAINKAVEEVTIEK